MWVCRELPGGVFQVLVLSSSHRSLRQAMHADNPIRDNTLQGPLLCIEALVQYRIHKVVESLREHRRANVHATSNSFTEGTGEGLGRALAKTVFRQHKTTVRCSDNAVNVVKRVRSMRHTRTLLAPTPTTSTKARHSSPCDILTLSWILCRLYSWMCGTAAIRDSGASATAAGAVLIQNHGREQCDICS